MQKISQIAAVTKKFKHFCQTALCGAKSDFLQALSKNVRLGAIIRRDLIVLLESFSTIYNLWG